MYQLENNNLTVGDLFCGAGIGGLGFKLAGFKTIYAFDNNPHAVATYNMNVEPVAYIADANLININELPYTDVITAGFPCKPFSVAGKNLGLNDVKHGNLGLITLNIISIKKPKAFLIENVSGLTNKQHKQTFKEMVEFLQQDYNVTHELIDCGDYGVPQKRIRVFIIGIRKDINKFFAFPEKQHTKKTINDAIGDLPKIPDNSIKNHDKDCGIRTDEKPFVNQIPVGGNWKSLPIDQQKLFMKNAFYSGGGKTCFLHKVDPNKPSKTILSSPMGKATAQILHWENCEPRRYTVRECLRLQTVPDNFYFDENIPLMKQYERCSGIPTLIAWTFMKEIAKILGEL